VQYGTDKVTWGVVLDAAMSSSSSCIKKRQEVTFATSSRVRWDAIVSGRGSEQGLRGGMHYGAQVFRLIESHANSSPPWLPALRALSASLDNAFPA
jgi:hypothetical protein